MYRFRAGQPRHTECYRRINWFSTELLMLQRTMVRLQFRHQGQRENEGQVERQIERNNVRTKPQQGYGSPLRPTRQVTRLEAIGHNAQQQPRADHQAGWFSKGGIPGGAPPGLKCMSESII